jgi:hypothetical protein
LNNLGVRAFVPAEDWVVGLYDEGGNKIREERIPSITANRLGGYQLNFPDGFVAEKGQYIVVGYPAPDAPIAKAVRDAQS